MTLSKSKGQWNNLFQEYTTMSKNILDKHMDIPNDYLKKGFNQLGKGITVDSVLKKDLAHIYIYMLHFQMKFYKQVCTPFVRKTSFTLQNLRGILRQTEKYPFMNVLILKYKKTKHKTYIDVPSKPYIQFPYLLTKCLHNPIRYVFFYTIANKKTTNKILGVLIDKKEKVVTIIDPEGYSNARYETYNMVQFEQELLTYLYDRKELKHYRIVYPRQYGKHKLFNKNINERNEHLTLIMLISTTMINLDMDIYNTLNELYTLKNDNLKLNQMKSEYTMGLYLLLNKLNHYVKQHQLIGSHKIVPYKIINPPQSLSNTIELMPEQKE